MSAPDVFARVAQDSHRAITTFLPSLSPKPAPPPPVPPPQMSAGIKEGLRVASLARHVETSAKRVARGLPPQPPPPPSPQEQFPAELDQVHIRALTRAIADHPEELRAPLIHEAHSNLVKWIAAHNGQIVHDGKMQIANSPQGAETLAAKIINEAVDAHDQREAEAAEALANDDGSGGNGTSAGSKTGRSGVSGKGRPVPDATAGRSKQAAAGTPVPTDQPQPAGGDAGVGGIEPDSGRVVTQPVDDLDQAQKLATAAAPDLKQKLQSVTKAVPGANVDGVREKKHPDRAKQKVENEDKPANTVSDLLAGRIAVDSPEAKDQAVAALKSQAPVIDEEDSFQQGDPDYGFRSHTLQAVMPNGSSAEVQVVPQEIADADEDTHETYERGRQAEIEGDTETANDAMAENRQAHDDAMQEFNARQKPDLRKTVEAAGFKVAGNPIKIGGKLFIAVNPD